MVDAKKIVIGIPTFRRPQLLRRLLESIGEQRAPFTPHVLVADNEGTQGRGLKVIEEVRGKGFPFPLTGIPVSERGISHVRNALMRVAFEDLSADALAMVDDDERVGPLWIAELVAMQEKNGFDVVGGSVIPEFEDPPPKWVNGLNIYWRKVYLPGPVSMINGTTNVLFARGLHENFPSIIFDHNFGLTGGEDKEFFVRLKRKGARFGFAPAAVSYELFGASRTTKRWAIQRAFRIGSGDARVFKLHSPSTSQWVLEISKLFAALVLSPLHSFARPWSSAALMRTCLTVARQYGKLNGLFGKPPQVYETIHGK